MTRLLEKLDQKKSQDIIVLAGFISIYCRENHRSGEKQPFPIKDEKIKKMLSKKVPTLCPECEKLLQHGIAKLALCPHDPKPMCKKCGTQCYAPGYREKIREVMRFSGKYLIKHGRLDLLFHYIK